MSKRNGKGAFKMAENHKLVEMDRGGIRCMVKKSFGKIYKKGGGVE